MARITSRRRSDRRSAPSTGRCRDDQKPLRRERDPIAAQRMACSKHSTATCAVLLVSWLQRKPG
uniref:Uncharacterized protein n=1 Tax=Anguilla anguilla TaxID=7936 RepID=A0A0E9TV63_ANGAN